MKKDIRDKKSSIPLPQSPKESSNETIKLSEESFEKMIGEVEDYAIILLDLEGQIISWNKGAERIKGYSYKEIIGKSFKLFYPKEDKERGLPDELIRIAKQSGKAVHEGWRIRKDGTQFWGNITLTAIHNEEGVVTSYLKVTRDLTERKIAADKHYNYMEELKQRNEALRLSEERYHKMIAEVQDYAILLLNKEGIIENWNVGAEILKGYTHSEIIGKSFENFYLQEDIDQGLPKKLLKEAEVTGRASTEGWRKRKDGTKFWASVVITSLHDEAGELIGFSKVTRDLTEKKKAEDQTKAYAEELENKNRTLETLNDELSSFAYIVSHDLKEPIRKIRIFAARQKESGKSIEQFLDYSEKIEQSAVKMQNLMDNLLAYSELSSENIFKDVDLNEVLLSVKYDLEVLISEKQATIHSGKLPVVKGIQYQIQQLFLNLISNSLKFSKPNEKPELKIDSSEVDGSTLSEELKNKSHIGISFVDNGIGFSPEHSKKIFEIFQRLQPKESTGSGIGLAIVKKVMLNHSGFVTAESEPGKGATFKIYFPKP